MLLHFDFSTGASGDKILGSLIEVCEGLGTATFDELQRLADQLVSNVRMERLSPVQGHKNIRATSIAITEDSAPHRNWKDIRLQIETAGKTGVLTKHACALSLEVFEALARAEAAVHNTALEEVHFHEIGATDSIIDICCSSFLLDRLHPQEVLATPLALGFGTFICSHGELPVPAPATAKLIESLPVFAGAHKGELTTPTGAALARVFVTEWAELPCMKPTAVGYGAGTRTLEGAANVVRAIAGERITLAGLAPQEGFALEGCTLLETNIDHLSSEALAFACEELLAQGANDVWQEPVVMKKGRLAVRLCVLCPVVKAQCFTAAIIELTGSLGVRRTYVERACVPREVVLEQTNYGEVRYKTALVGSPEGRIKLKRPEYEDVARIAREQGLGFNKLYDELCHCQSLHI